MKKEGLDKKRKGERIDNIPKTGTLTGKWETNFYGCWWEVIPDDNSKNFWMIGEYPI